MSTKQDAMLVGLDAVPWSTLQHAYGEASDVPEMLRELTSDDEEAREGALDALFGNIWHQGTVYGATSHAVPFLVELFASPAVQNREGIAHLLFSISRGSSYLDAHQHLSFVGDQLKQEPGFAENLKRELADVEAARVAFSRAHPTFFAVLDGDRDLALRRQALRLLSACVRDAPVVLRELQRRLPALKEPSLRANAAFALAVLDPAGARPLLAQELSAESPVVQFAAALALGLFAEPFEPRAGDVLLQHLEKPGQFPYEDLPFGEDLAADVGAALRRAPAELRLRAAEVMLKRAQAKEAAPFAVVPQLLALAFEPGKPPAELSPLQRRIVEYVASLTWTRIGASWSTFANFAQELRAYGLEALGEKLVGYR